jgi:hypothetical protein
MRMRKVTLNPQEAHFLEEHKSEVMRRASALVGSNVSFLTIEGDKDEVTELISPNADALISIIRELRDKQRQAKAPITA